MIRGLLVLAITLIAVELSGQDFHFSQFYATPTLLNPAMTGNHGAGFRVGGINRSQFSVGSNNFQTVALYGDVALLQNAVAENSWVGLGGKMYYDNAGQGTFNTFHAAMQLTFHKALTDQFYLSFGGSFGFTRKSFDESFAFNTQYTEQGFDTALPSGENLLRTSYSNMDVDAGVSATYAQSKDTRITFGMALLHINRPGEQLYLEANTDINRRAFRPVVHVNATIGLMDFHIEPGFVFSRDRGAQELIFGSNFAYAMNEDARVTFGLWNRWDEAIIPMIGFEFMRTRILATYDVNIQSTHSFGSSRSAFEVSVAHTGKWRERTGGIACPRF